MQNIHNLECNNTISDESITPESLGISREETELSNKTKLVVLEKPNAPVYMRATFLSGRRFDPMGKEGTAHFLEHMLVAGTSRFPTKDKLAAYIEQYGGDLGAVTGAEVIEINSTVADPTDLRVCVDVMHEMLLEPLFDSQTLEMERGAILKELGDKKSNPERMLWELFPNLFFKDTERGRAGLGSEESIQSITRDDLIHFYHEAITSGRLSLLTCGGVTVDEVKALAEKNLLVPEGPELQISRELPINRETPILVEQYKDTDQVHLMFGFRTEAQDGSENTALNMIAETLGGGRSSVLDRKLCYERGLVYESSAFTLEESDSGVLLIKTSTSKDKVQEVMDVITGEIKRIIDQGLTPDEVAFAKKKIIKSLRMQLQASHNWVNIYTDWERGVGKPFGIADYTKGISECTSAITQSVAQKYFANDKWYLAMCGDVNSADVKIDL
jgi:predicted Zn-dependent peptidase